MSDDPLARLTTDLAVMQQALALRVPYGRGMLRFDLLLALAAAAAALASLAIQPDWLQQAPFAAIMLLVLLGLYGRAPQTSHDTNLQVVLSLGVYAAVWVAACGYQLATTLALAVGPARIALLYATGIGTLGVCALLLVCAALRSKTYHYCLGPAVSAVLAGMLLPILASHHSYAVAHGCMAVGFLLTLAIQRGQLRMAAANALSGSAGDLSRGAASHGTH